MTKNILTLILAACPAFASYAYRLPIIIDHTKASSTLTNFPMLVSVTNGAFKTVANGGSIQNLVSCGCRAGILVPADGPFYASDGTTILPADWESYNATTGAVAVWVKIPSISSSVDTTFYFYYGDASVSTLQYTASDVWDGNNQLTWHLADGSTLNANDSTSAARNGTNASATATTGKIDGGAAFGGAASINLASAPISAYPFAISTWFRTTDATASFRDIANMTNTGNNDHFATVQLGSAQKVDCSFRAGNGAVTAVIFSTATTYNDGNWHHAVCIAHAQNSFELFVDGVSDGTSTTSLTSFPTLTVSTVGAQRRVATANYFTGTIDEVRFHSSDRSAAWWSAAYSTVNSPGTFFSVGSPESPSAVPRAQMLIGKVTFRGTFDLLRFCCTVIPDTTAPELSGVGGSNGSTTATVTWTTDELASTRLAYGETPTYGSLTTETDTAPRVLSHSAGLTGLNACYSYHYQARSRDASLNQGVSADGHFFTGECSPLYSPDLPAACDAYDPNTEIHVRTAGDVTTVRAAAISDIWRVTQALPTRQPDTVTTNIGTTIPYLTTTGWSNLANIDQMDITLEGGFNSRVYLLKPTSSNGRLLIAHQGHGDTGLDPFGLGVTIQQSIAEGFYVIAAQVPMTGPNTGPVSGRSSTAHNNMAALETSTFNPLKVFLEPVVVALNYAVSAYGFSTAAMFGISGGGQMTALASAIDPRITLSIPVAGSYPLALRGSYSACGGPGTEYDYEQGSLTTTTTLPYHFFTSVASYLDLYILASAGSGRKQIPMYSQQDDCCFAGVRYRMYERTVANIASALSGTFGPVYLDTVNVTHQISALHRAQIAAALGY